MIPALRPRLSWWLVALTLTTWAVPRADAQTTLLVVHKWGDSLGIYDFATGQSRATIPVGRKPHELAVTPDGKWAFVTLYGIDRYTETAEGGRAVAVVDLAQRAKVGEIDLGRYRRPHGIEAGASGRLYVTCDHPAALLVLDPAKRAVLRAIDLRESLPHMVALSHDEKRAFVANSGSGTVSAVDLAGDAPPRSIQVGGVPMGLALTADGRTLFATTRTANSVAVIDTATLRVARVIDVPGQPVRACLTPDGQTLLVTLIESGELAVIDATNHFIRRRLPVGKQVEGVTTDAAGRFGLASAQGENKVVQFSLTDWKPVREIKTGDRPDPLVLLP